MKNEANIGHWIRHNTFIRDLFEGKISRRRTRGRPRTYFILSRSETAHGLGHGLMSLFVLWYTDNSYGLNGENILNKLINQFFNRQRLKKNLN